MKLKFNRIVASCLVFVMLFTAGINGLIPFKSEASNPNSSPTRVDDPRVLKMEMQDGLGEAGDKLVKEKGYAYKRFSITFNQQKASTEAETVYFSLSQGLSILPQVIKPTEDIPEEKPVEVEGRKNITVENITKGVKNVFKLTDNSGDPNTYGVEIDKTSSVEKIDIIVKYRAEQTEDLTATAYTFNHMAFLDVVKIEKPQPKPEPQVETPKADNKDVADTGDKKEEPPSDGGDNITATENHDSAESPKQKDEVIEPSNNITEPDPKEELAKETEVPKDTDSKDIKEQPEPTETPVVDQVKPRVKREITTDILENPLLADKDEILPSLQPELTNLAPMRAANWDVSGATKSGSFYPTAGGQYSTTAEVVGNEVIWRITVSHGSMRGDYVQGISVGDIKTADIKEMTSTTRGNVYPPVESPVYTEMFVDKPLGNYSNKNLSFASRTADSTTFVIKQPISSTETTKTIKFKTSFLSYNATYRKMHAAEESPEITLTVVKQAPTTGDVTFKINMVPAGAAGPTAATATVTKNGATVGTLNLNTPMSLDPGNYTIKVNVPDGFQLYTGETPLRDITVTAGLDQIVTYNMVKYEAPNTGMATVNFTYTGLGTKPTGLTATATNQADNSVVILYDGVQKEIPAGVYRVIPNVPAGYEAVGNSAITLTLDKGGVSTVPFTIQKTTPKEGSLKFTTSVPAGTEQPTNVTATIVSGVIQEGVVKTLQTGIYEVVLNIPAGYALAPGQEQRVKVEVKEGQLSTVDFKLVKSTVADTGFLTVNVKSNATEPKPAGITAVAEKSGGIATTLVDGVKTKMETGRYTVRLNVPDGYETVGPSYYIVDLAKDADLPVNFTIQKKLNPSQIGNMKITVEDKDDGRIKISGSKIKITNDSNVYEGITDSNGVVEFINIPVGTYKIEQLYTQAGYFVLENIPDQQVKPGFTTEGTIQNVKNNTGILTPHIELTLRDGDLTSGPPIPGAKIELKDDLGNTYYGYTDGNGKVIFQNLSKLRRYTATAVQYPYVFGVGPRLLKEDIVFNLDPTAPPVTQVFAKLDRVELQTIDVSVFEQGDSRVKIPNAKVRVINPDGTFTDLTTDSNGAVSIQLPELSVYEFQQLTTDGRHIVNPQVYSVFVQRRETVEIPNRLIDPSSEKRNIVVKKEWSDPPPSPTAPAIIELLADGKKVGEASIQPDGTYIFANVNKYNDNHVMIKYTVKEKEVDGYYAVYTKNDVDGYNWTVTNYEGYSVGTCSSGNFWVSTTKVAYEVTAEGKATGRSINMDTGQAFDNYNTFGYAITVDYQRNILFAMNKWGYLQLRDLSSGNKIGSDINVGIPGVYQTNDYVNTMGISRDGSKIFAATWFQKNIFVYNTEDLIAAAKAGRNTSYAQMVPTTTLAGDLIELPNGDLLLSGDQGYGGSQIATGLWIHKKLANGSYSAAKQIGLIKNTDGVSSTHSVEGIGLVNNEVVITRPIGGTGSQTYGVFKLSPMPSYDMPSSSGEVFTATRLGDATFTGVLADAADNANTPCAAFVKVTGTKLWEGDEESTRPKSIIVRLYKNGVATNITQVVSPDDNGNWKFSFTDLDKYDSQGNPIKYTVKEEFVAPGYEVTYPDGQGHTILNTMNLAKLVIQKVKQGISSFEPLSGAEFTLYKEDKTTVVTGPVAVDDKGMLTIGNLSEGTYYLKETKAPTGYALDENFYKVVVVKDASGKLTVKVYITDTNIQDNSDENPFTIENKSKPGGFEIRKVDENGKPILTGATFQLLDKDGKVIAEESIVNGVAKFTNIPTGEYKLIESKAPDGYVLSSRQYDLKVDGQGNVKIFLDGNEVSLDPLVIPNFKAEFPATGGSGTWLYTLVGFMMMAIALIRYWIGRRNGQRA